MKSWLQDTDTEMYSTHNEEKSVVAERLIRTLENIFVIRDFNTKQYVYQ